MINVRKTDPRFTNFRPNTAAEAVDRYVRCRNNGLKPMLIPECLIACARGLDEKELDKFEQWIINPCMDFSHTKLVEQTAIREANDAVFEANLSRVEAHLQNMTVSEVPPLPVEADIEMQCVSDDDEKMFAPSDR